jgi:hypothetical protein
MKTIAICATYFVLAALRLWPLLAGLDHKLPDEADGAQVAWTLWSVGTRLGAGYPGLFESNAFHPHPGALLYGDSMIGPGILAAPLLALGLNAIAVANVLVVATVAASAIAVHFLARALTGSHLAAATAAMTIAFGSFAMSNQARLQILGVHWMAFALLALYRWLGEGRARHAWTFAAASALVALSCLYYLPFFGVAVIVLGAGFAAASPLSLNARPWRPAILPVLGCLAVVAGLAWPYLRLHDRYAFRGGTPRPFDLVLYLTPPADSIAYPAATALRPEGFYLTYFIGYLVLALAAAGAIAVFRSRRTASSAIWIAVIVLGVLAVVLSAGPEIVWRGERVAPGPYRLLMALPPFTNMREPRRFAVLVVLCAGLLAARGVAALLARSPQRFRAVIGIAIAALVGAEHAATGDTRGVDMPGGRDLPPVYRWLAEHDGPEPIAELPVRPLRLHRSGALEQYFATEHRRPTLNGWPSFPPPALELIRFELRDFPDARSIALLRGLGVRYAVVHPRRWHEERARFERRLQERSDILPTVARFEERPHAVWDRFELGGETVLEVSRGDVPAAQPCACRPLDAGAITAAISEGGDASLATDGSRETRWTTAPADQRQGMFLELRLERPRHVARVDVAAAFPYGEFGRYVEVLGLVDGEWRRVGPRADHGALLATVRALVDDPQKAWLTYAVDPVPMAAVRLVIGRDPEAATGPWSIPEIRLQELTDAGATMPAGIPPTVLETE